MPTPQTTPRPANKKPAPTFAQLCKVYRSLPALALDAARVAERGQEADAIGDPDADKFCANREWYDGGPRSLCSRVKEIAQKAGHRFGWAAYDTIYLGVYDKLPDCGGQCGCIRREDWD